MVVPRDCGSLGMQAVARPVLELTAVVPGSVDQLTPGDTMTVRVLTQPSGPLGRAAHAQAARCNCRPSAAFKRPFDVFVDRAAATPTTGPCPAHTTRTPGTCCTVMDCFAMASSHVFAPREQCNRLLRVANMESPQNSTWRVGEYKEMWPGV